MSGNNWTGPPPPNGTWPGFPPPPNGTWPGFPPRNGSWPDGDDPDHFGTWNRSSFLPETSYVVATCYLSFLCIIAVIMCFRNRTRLRAYACFITYIGLTIAVIGLMRAKHLLGPPWFWAWNFFGESFGVVILALTIVSVGSGFYPMQRHRNLYWRMSMSVIVIYALVALATVVCYVFTKVVYHHISAADVQQLRNQIIDKGILTDRQLEHQRRWEQIGKHIPDIDTAQVGAQDWRELTWAEREMFARPSTPFYLGHQILMLMTCLWVCLYLFIPLVIHHRHGPIGRPVDGDMMAVGVWYLSTLLTLALAYTILNVFYIVNTDYIYEQHMQALDLCMRITIGPIFFLPAPAFLLRFYRERFQKMKANSGSGRNGSGNRNGGSSNHYNGSFTNSAVNNTNVSPEGTQVGSRFGTTGESSVTRCSQDNNQDNKPQDKLQKGQEPTSPSGTYSRFKLFQSRERGPSVESRRMLNKDFDCESVDSHQQPSEPRAHSFQTYQNLNNNGDRELRATPLYDPLRNEDLLLSGETLRVPEPALTGEHLQAERSITPTGWKDVETRPKGLAGSRKGSETTVHQLQVSTDDTLRSEGTGKTHDQPDTVTGSTGWEVGGHGARKSEDAPKLGQISNDTNPAQDAQQPSSGGFSHLTGLQRQLAEHRSALLPRVIAYQAYHEDLTSGEPFEPKLKPINPYDLSASRQGTSEANMGQTVDSSKRADDQVGGSLFEAEPQSPTHLVDPTHWSLSPSSQTWTGTDSGVTSFNTPGGSKSRESKSKEGLMAAFSKALNSKDKGSNKDHGPSSQTRSNSDAKDRGTKNGGDSAFELSSTPIAPTVGELAQLSTRVRAGESSKLQTNYDYDPYDEQPGFRRFRDSIRQDPIDGSIHESKGSSTSIATKGGSTPSLGSSKSRDSLSKNNATKESQGRPISPPKKSSSRSTPRATRSKSDGAFSEGIESPRTPTVEMPMNATRLMSAAVAAATAPPPVASPTSDILDFPPSPMVKTSLSPPPRQSWRRTSKNFKNVQPPIIPIDTTVGDGEPMPYIETLTSAPINGIITIPSPAANSPPSHPLQTSGQRGNSPDYSSNDWSRVSREREMTTQMSPRRASSRRQKSADNMASSYYYKRASELTNSGSSQSPRSARESSARSPSHGSPPSPSVRTASYRSSPSPSHYNSMTSSGGSSSMTSISHPLGASFGTDSSSGENHSRASSFNSRILADDSWTQAMINRAQTKTKPSPSLPSAQQQQQRDLNDLNRDRENRAVSPVYNTYRRPSVGRATTE